MADVEGYKDVQDIVGLDFSLFCFSFCISSILGDFTQETQIRCKLEQEKRLHVDEWKVGFA